MRLSLKNKLILLLVSFLTLAIYTATTSPLGNKMVTTVGFLGIIFLIVYIVVSIILEFSLTTTKTSKVNTLALVISLGPTYLIAISSLNTIGFIDVIFVIVTQIIVVWYLVKTIK